MLNVSQQELRAVLEPGGTCRGHVVTTFTDGTYSVSPSIEAEMDEPWDRFIGRVFERVDYQLSLW
jgi:hypothetical protein